jgi:hypothetical protein
MLNIDGYLNAHDETELEMTAAHPDCDRKLC